MVKLPTQQLQQLDFDKAHFRNPTKAKQFSAWHLFNHKQLSIEVNTLKLSSSVDYAVYLSTYWIYIAPSQDNNPEVLPTQINVSLLILQQYC